MPKKATWTEAQDIQIKRLRAEGRTWDEISHALGLNRWAVIERGRRIGARPPPPGSPPPGHDANRDPLPAGSAVTWSAITRDSVLEGLPYRPIRPR